MRGADLLAQTLSAAGVTRIYSLSGNQIMPIYDACLDANIEIVHTRHEGAAVFMADAWAQLTGQPGIALVTAAPGFANALGAVFSARSAESPVILLSGDSPLAADGKGAFQELDQVAISAPLCKASFRSQSADAMGDDMLRAVTLATAGRPGPVQVALPFDVLEATTQATVPAMTAPKNPDLSDHAAVVAQHLAAAARPLILTGPCCNRTRQGDLLHTLRTQHKVPVLSMESPRGLNDPSLGALARAIYEAELIVSLGKRIDFTLGTGKVGPINEATQWLVVDADSDAITMAMQNLGSRLLHSVDAAPIALGDTLASIGGNAPGRDAWLAKVDEWIAEREHTRLPDLIDGQISPASLCAAVQRQIDRLDNVVLVCDGGEFGQWAQACTTAGSRVINGPSGAIGGSICYAIAACQARPDARVIAMMGDGTSGFHLSEFETAAREGTPLVAVIGNDECWNAEHQIQLREYGEHRLTGCMLSEARYDLAVAGLGGHGEYVTDLADLDAALDRALASGKPACVNVRITGMPAPNVSAG